MRILANYFGPFAKLVEINANERSAVMVTFFCQWIGNICQKNSWRQKSEPNFWQSLGLTQSNSNSVLFDLELCIYADIALDEVADDQHGMSASTLNLGQKKGYEAWQKLKKFKQIP